MDFSLLDNIYTNFSRFSDNNAFFICGEFFTYDFLSGRVMKIASRILADTSLNQKTIGVVTDDHIDTYASILAIWFTGNIFVPVNPGNPPDRLKQIVDQADLKTVFAPGGGSFISESGLDVEFVSTQELPADSGKIDLPQFSGDNLLYLLFTSGSTGVPKGVPISLKNLESFVSCFNEYEYRFSSSDRFLQIYDLSFDGSFPSYIVPLIAGACIYTVPQDEIRYLYALKLMQEHELTVVKMTPSTVAYLRPYFDKIRLEKLKYCIFGGEALNADLVEKWSKCIPNAAIHNVYGPTEATIICMIYKWSRHIKNKQLNGILSIGKILGSSKALVVDSHLYQVNQGEKGELCISGDQLMQGYWKDPEKDKVVFFDHDEEGKEIRFYRTGDMVIRDADGDFLFAGRLDEQVQIDGFRVELGEIEKHARDFTRLNNIAAISVLNEQNTNQIYLFVEGSAEGRVELMQYLESKLPYYMVPSTIQFIEEMPKSTGGKIQKSKLKDMLP